MTETLGQKIKRLRKAKGLTQRVLADAVEIDFTYLSKIENDNIPYPPSSKTLKKLAAHLEVSELGLLQTAERLPEEVQSIAQSERGLQFLRRASSFKNPQEWEDLFAFLDEKENLAKKAAQGMKKTASARKRRSDKK